MPLVPKTAPVDYLVLADALAALGYPMRLELLDHLKFPHSIGEVRVSPARVEAGGSPDRPAARQTVQYHLEKLVEAGFVREEAAAEPRAGARFVVNPQRLYAVTEELRRLSLHYAGRGPAGDETGTIAGPQAWAPVAGPRLVLVHGVYEGKQFVLDPALHPDRRWTIGRKRGLPVALDYDPFVSLENAVVVATATGHEVADIGASKNGTSVNWTPLPRGGVRALKSGDLIGVGRSLLLFLAD